MSLRKVISSSKIRRPSLAKLINIAKLLRQKIALWRRNSQGRYQLAEFSEHQLKDIGITPCQRMEEIRKHFWQ